MWFVRHQSSSGSCLEYFSDAFFGLGRAFVVTHSSDLCLHRLPVFLRDGNLLISGQQAQGLLVCPQVLLAAHQDHRHLRAEVFHLRDPALGDVLQAVGAADGETEEEHVGVGVGERPESVIVFLTWILSLFSLCLSLFLQTAMLPAVSQRTSSTSLLSI